MRSSEPDRTAFLDAFRAVTIAMVVAIHARGYVELAPSIDSMVAFAITTIAVPSFFLCDGYLLVLRGAARVRAGYLDYVKRSAQRLLIPWVVFSVLYTFARALFEWVGVLEEQVVVGQSLWQVAIEIYSSGIAPQMYFLLSLFLIRTGAFAFRRLADGNVALPWVAFTAYTLLYRLVWADPLRAFFSTGFDPVLHAAWGLQFYLLGIALARLETVVLGRSIAFAAIAWITLGAGLGIGLDETWPAVTQYAYLLGALFVFVALGERAGSLARFGRDSMGIYLLHAPILLKATAILCSSFFASPFIRYFFICVSALGLSWLATKALKTHAAGRWLLAMPTRG